jgi:hypothetical protein
MRQKKITVKQETGKNSKADPVDIKYHEVEKLSIDPKIKLRQLLEKIAAQKLKNVSATSPKKRSN